MTEIVLSVSRHQSHCVFSVEFVVFQSRMGEDMLDALIVAFYSCYKQRLKKNKRCTGLCDCGFSENTRPKQVFNFENNPVPMNFWIVYMHGYRCIQTDSFFLLFLFLLSNYGHRTWYACGTAKQYTLLAADSLRKW